MPNACGLQELCNDWWAFLFLLSSPAELINGVLSHSESGNDPIRMELRLKSADKMERWRSL